MKKQVIATILGAALALPLIAQAQVSYLGANVGRAEQKARVDGFGSFKDNDASFKLYGGHEFTPNLGVELGYVNFGEADKSFGPVNASSKPQSLYLAGTGTLPLSEQISLFGKVGVSVNRTKIRAPGFSDTERNTTALLGIGAAYKFAPNMSMVAEYENFGKVLDEDGGNIKADLVSIGLRYKF